MKVEQEEGMVRMYVDLSVTLNEMKEWAPERIAAFFDGLAKIRTAVQTPDAAIADTNHPRWSTRKSDGNFRSLKETS